MKIILKVVSVLTILYSTSCIHKPSLVVDSQYGYTISTTPNWVVKLQSTSEPGLLECVVANYTPDGTVVQIFIFSPLDKTPTEIITEIAIRLASENVNTGRNILDESNIAPGALGITVIPSPNLSGKAIAFNHNYTFIIEYIGPASVESTAAVNTLLHDFSLK